MISTLAIIDFETTGLVHATDHVIEAALAIYSVPDATIIRVRSWLVAAPPEAVAATQHVHRIPPSLVAKRGVPFVDVVRQIHGIATKEADAFVSHNADFDRPWLPEYVQTCRDWICTCNDCEWPMASGSRSLLALAHAHGVQVGALHRAADDVLLVGRLFERVQRDGFDVPAMLARAMRPKKRYRADVSYDTNALAKAAGFRWSPDERIWHKAICPEDLPELKLPFAVHEVAS